MAVGFEANKKVYAPVVRRTYLKEGLKNGGGGGN